MQAALLRDALNKPQLSLEAIRAKLELVKALLHMPEEIEAIVQEMSEDERKKLERTRV